MYFLIAIYIYVLIYTYIVIYVYIFQQRFINSKIYRQYSR